MRTPRGTLTPHENHSLKKCFLFPATVNGKNFLLKPSYCLKNEVKLQWIAKKDQYSGTNENSITLNLEANTQLKQVFRNHQGHNEVRWRPGQEASLAPPCSSLRSLQANVRRWRKYLWHCWDFSAPPAAIRRPHSGPAPGKLLPPCPPLVTPLITTITMISPDVNWYMQCFVNCYMQCFVKGVLRYWNGLSRFSNILSKYTRTSL